MPRCWPDRVIMYCVIGLVAWAIIGLPPLRSFWPAYNPAKAQTAEPTANGAKTQEPWLTKDAAGFFTFVLVVVGSVQVALFLWQLWLIRESLDDTKIAAEAAKQAADVAKIQTETAKATLQTMQDTAERQLRAYVFAEPATFSSSVYNRARPREVGLVKNTGPMQRLTYQVRITNTGQTPAFDFRQATAHDVFDEPVTDDKFHIGQGGPFSRATLAAGRDVTTGHVMDIVPEEYRQIREGRKSFYVFGEIHYTDAFKKKRIVRFRFLHGQHTGLQQLSYAEAGNEEIDS
jgi:hypothetical protein